MRIAIFFHCLTHLGNPPELLPHAVTVINEQMCALEQSGLLKLCSEFIVGANGGDETKEILNLLIPARARIVLHGLESRSENLTIIEVEKFAKANPSDWLILYFHSKNATRDATSEYGRKAEAWRRCMVRQCVTNWRQAVQYLQQGYDVACVHWRTGIMPDQSQHYAAGNHWWCTSRFFATLPSLYTRARIKQSGIGNLESRYEAEIILGTGPRLPRVKDMDTTHGFFECHKFMPEPARPAHRVIG